MESIQGLIASAAAPRGLCGSMLAMVTGWAAVAMTTTTPRTTSQRRWVVDARGAVRIAAP
jgi:hypothetical protein